MAASVSLGGAARGQDALTRALSLEPVISTTQTAPVDLRPDQPHIGPVRLSLGMYGGADVNDNVNATQSAEVTDVLLRGGMRLGVLWPVTDQSQLQFGGSVGYVHYLRTPHNDHLDAAPDSALTWAIGFDDGTVTLFDQFSYIQDIQTEAAVSGVAVFPRLENTIGARVDWLPGHWALALGYSHDNFLSDSAQYNYLNRSSEYFFGRSGWRFAEKTQLGLEASASLTSYELPIQPDNKSISFGPYLEWQATHALNVTLRGGSVIYLFDTTQKSLNGSQLDSYYFGLTMSHQLTDFLSQRLSAQREVRQGANQGSAYIEQWTGNYSIVWAITQRIGITGSFLYEKGRQPFDVPIFFPPFGEFIVETIENYERYGPGVSVSWRTTDKLTTSLAYNYWLRTSNLANNRYQQNIVSFNVTYAF